VVAAPVVVAGAGAALGGAAAVGADRLIRTSQLACGLRLVTEAMPDVRSVTTGFWVGTGSRDERAGEIGASHFLEHLLFKGTPTRTARAIAEAVDAVGGDMNAFTTKEYTAFYVRLLAEHLDLGLDVLCDIMWSPALRPDELEAERQVILEEILMHGDEPADLVYDRFAAALFPDHPLGREVLGTQDSIEAMATGQVRQFFEEHYRPANMVVAAAGAVDHDRAAAGIEARFAGLAGGAPPRRTPPDGRYEPSVVVPRSTEQAHLVVGVRAPDRHDPDRWPLAILDHALGGGASSRLFQEIRERRGLAYSVYSDRVAYEDTGSLAVYVGTTPSRVRDVLELVTMELDRLTKDGITAHELDVARGHLRAETLLALEDSAARMSRIGRSLLLHHEVLTVDELLARIDAVTVEHVGAAARRVLGGPRTVVVLGPYQEADLAAAVR
jgi:predicted Zn-dependent peptidase